jgi:DNA polymerase-3 subunit gamma/tau
MSYQAFYREWRPQLFQDVVGQSHIVRTLQNALASGKTAHAYLFSGPRGTGKTSIAKLFAKTINCLNGPAAEPCNVCINCVRIMDGVLIDVLEIDAASNRGIDEIRDLKDKVRYLPAEGKYKVYIIDEVHMLTTEAFNALLKTLEEPPAHVIFLLATTEPHKLPATILSRCQRFNFHRLSTREITQRLRQVAESHQISASDSALMVIARYAEGALRDALGLLEQAAAYGEGTISEKDVLAILGTISEDIAILIAEAVRKEATGDMLQIINDVISSGKDPREFLRSICLHFRSLLLIKTTSEPEEMLGISELGISRLREQSTKYTEKSLIRIIEQLNMADSDLRWAVQPRIAVEIALLRLMSVSRKVKAESIEERMEALEEEFALLKEKSRGIKAVDPTPVIICGDSDESVQYLEKGQTDIPIASENIMSRPPQDIKGVCKNWPDFMERVKKKSRPLYSLLMEGKPISFEAGQLVLEFKFAVHKEQVEKRENRLTLETMLKEAWESPVQIVGRLAVEDTPGAGGAIRSEQHQGEQQESDEKVEEVLDLFGGQLFDL